MKQYTIKRLVDKLRELNIIHAQTYEGALQVVHYWMRSGKLKLRQSPHSGYHYVTDDEIEQIVKEFDFNGQGFWSFEN